VVKVLGDEIVAVEPCANACGNSHALRFGKCTDLSRGDSRHSRLMIVRRDYRRNQELGNCGERDGNPMTCIQCWMFELVDGRACAADCTVVAVPPILPGMKASRRNANG
jgi:hypothetical protein